MNITVDRKVIEQALEALDYVMRHGPAVQKAKDLLQNALEQPEQRWTPENIAAMRRLQEKQYQRDAMRQKVQQEPVLWKDKHGKTLMSLDASQPIQELVCSTALEQPEQEFIKHAGDGDGWSEWVCPDPKSYMMKCCDCGLVHEAQFGVVRYASETEREDCEKVDDPNLQAVFRMRRGEQWTPEDTAYRPGGLEQTEQEPVREVWCGCGDSIMPDSGAKCGNCLAAEARLPLTDEEIQAIWKNTFESGASPNTFARAIEAAHNIKE